MSKKPLANYKIFYLLEEKRLKVKIFFSSMLNLPYFFVFVFFLFELNLLVFCSSSIFYCWCFSSKIRCLSAFLFKRMSWSSRKMFIFTHVIKNGIQAVKGTRCLILVFFLLLFREIINNNYWCNWLCLPTFYHILKGAWIKCIILKY